MVKCKSKNLHQKDMCLKEIGIRAKFDQFIDEVGVFIYHLKRNTIFNLIMNKIPNHMSSRNCEENDYGLNLNLLIISH